MIRRELTNWTLSGPVKSVFPAHVPGDVTDDLHRAGLIEDPLFGENLKKLSWIYDADWTYECLFDADGEIFSQKNIYLFFEGIDTFSEILLNGILLGKTNNMFLAYKFPVNGIVKEKGNRLVVRIFSSVGIGKQKNDGKNYRALFNQDRLFLRKAQCQFGWDWAPDLPGIGIWLPAYLLADGGIVIEDLKLTSRTDGTVTFALSLKTDRSLENCSLCICAGERSAEYRAQEFGEYEIKIENAQLWWPNGYGEQRLYSYFVRISEKGVVCDEKRGKFAFREAELYQEPLKDGKYSFGIKINGRKIFSKGSNWVPCSNMTGAISEDRYARYLKIAKKSNFNILRVWGGGIYEKERFYDLCDEYGIMVWQDFMFSCSAIPAEIPGLEESFMTEAEYQIKRLRNRPSLVLWCGGNEYMPDLNGVPYEKGNKLIKEKLPALLKNTDGTRPYIYNSPISLEGDDWNFASGDNHTSCLNAVLAEDKVEKFRDYIAEKPSHFISESAVLGSCRIRSLKKFMPKDKLWPINDCWEYHFVKNPHNVRVPLPFTWQEQKVARDLFGDISSLPEFTKKSMAAMSEIIRGEMDFARANPECAGYMNWMYNDTWGCGTWALVDYFYETKPALYAMKRAFSVLYLCFTEKKDGTYLCLINETGKDLEGKIKFCVKMLDGSSLFEDEFFVQIKNDGVFARKTDRFDENDYMTAQFFAEGRQTEKSVYFNRLWRDKLFSSDIVYSVRRASATTYLLHIKANSFARMVFIDYPDNAGVFYEDNYFDMEKGDERTITIETEIPVDPSEFTVKTFADEWDD